MTEQKLYIIREQNQTDNPADEGPEVMRFKDWDQAVAYQNQLYAENGTKTYISICDK